MSEIILSGRLNGKQHNRLKRLFDMDYKPSELADRIGIDKNQIYRVYMLVGCPYEREKSGRLWINGKAFRVWYQEAYKKRELAEDEAFCLTCKKEVKMVNPVQRKKKGVLYWRCECQTCGRVLARII